MATLSSASDLEDLVKVQLSGLSSLVTTDGYEFACDQAYNELGWSYPVTNPTQVLWMIKRATRHALDILRIASANKFKYKQVNLQHRFDHFQKLIEDLDKEFLEALTYDIAPLGSGLSSFKLFGTKLDAGFSYGIDGTDETYKIDKYVNFSPVETD
jgi:hypothetical protein